MYYYYCVVIDGIGVIVDGDLNCCCDIVVDRYVDLRCGERLVVVTVLRTLLPIGVNWMVPGVEGQIIELTVLELYWPGVPGRYVIDITWLWKIIVISLIMVAWWQYVIVVDNCGWLTVLLLGWLLLWRWIVDLLLLILMVLLIVGDCWLIHWLLLLVVVVGCYVVVVLLLVLDYCWYWLNRLYCCCYGVTGLDIVDLWLIVVLITLNLNYCYWIVIACDDWLDIVLLLWLLWRGVVHCYLHYPISVWYCDDDCCGGWYLLVLWWWRTTWIDCDHCYCNITVIVTNDWCIGCWWFCGRFDVVCYYPVNWLLLTNLLIVVTRWCD